MKYNKGSVGAVLLIIILVLLVGGGMYYLGVKKSNVNVVPEQNNFTNNEEKNKEISDSSLKLKIESFMESSFKKNVLSNKVACSSILYGNEEKYSYAWVYCGEFDGSKKLVQASSGATRLEYSSVNDPITGFKEASECCSSESVDREIFPGKYYDLMIKGHPTNDEIKQLEQDALNKVR